MTGTPEDHQPAEPRAAATEPGWPGDDGEFGDCLTAEELAELARQDWLADCPDPDDPQNAQENGPPALTAGEWARLHAVDDERAQNDERTQPGVPEMFDAGFTHSRGGNGSGFSAGGPLDVMLPGSRLGWQVFQQCRRGAAALDDDQLIGLLAAVRRQASLDEALQLDLVAELDRRRAASDDSPGQHVDQELAAALTLTSWSANALLDLARDLKRLPKTRALLATGIIDPRRAAVIARHTAILSDGDAARVEDLILPRAGEMTTGELGSLCLRAVLKIDPHAARKRREKALKDARVETWLEPSGTAALSGRDLPPADVIAADKRIDAIARWLKTQGAQGTLKQLGAKVFLAILNNQPIESLLPATPQDPSTPDTGGTEQDGNPHDGTGTNGDSHDSTGHDSAAHDDTGHEGTGQTSTGHDSGETGDGATGTAGAAGSAPGASDGTAAPGNPPTGRSQTDRAGVSAAGVPRPAATGPVPPAATGPVPPAAGGPGSLTGTVHLVMPYDTWQGLNDNPGEIAGYGAADADTCRDIATHLAAATTTRWCITLTDRNGKPVGHGCARAGPGPPATTNPRSWLATLTIHPIETRTCAHLKQSAAYQPSNTLRHIIKTRSPRCGFPGCRRPAARCDDDHSIPYHLGGRTCECNLYPLCRRHHQCKQAPGWHLDQPRPGELIWTSPSGRTHTKITEPYPV